MNSLGRAPISPEDHIRRTALPGLDESPDHGGDDVTRREIEVVSGAVEVDDQQVDRIQTKLLAVCLGLDEEHLLGQSVRGIRLFGVAVPEISLAKRGLGVLRVGAHRPGNGHLPDLMSAARLEQFNAHDGVVIEEGPWRGPVGAYSSGHRSQVDDCVGCRVVQEALDLRPGPEVIVRAPTPMTLAPASSSSRRTCCPRNPVPPVTTIRARARCIRRHPRRRRERRARLRLPSRTWDRCHRRPVPIHGGGWRGRLRSRHPTTRTSSSPRCARRTPP